MQTPTATPTTTTTPTAADDRPPLAARFDELTDEQRDQVLRLLSFIVNRLQGKGDGAPVTAALLRAVAEGKETPAYA